jgi:hypothetical protein
MKTLRWLLAAPFLLVIVGVIGTELNKAYWDSRVRKLCESEGGITIYEPVTLTQDEYVRYDGIDGKIAIPDEGSNRAKEYQYVSSWDVTVLKKSNPEVVKSGWEICHFF